MKKILIVITVIAAVAIGAVIWLVGLPEKPYQLISQDYNLSASFPDTPTVTRSVNDEEDPKRNGLSSTTTELGWSTTTCPAPAMRKC